MAENEPVPRARKLSTFSKVGFRKSVFEEEILIEGALKKFSHGVFKRWQERYFTVQGHYLKYYTDSNKIQRDLKGTIDLAGMTGVMKTKKKGEFRVVVGTEKGGALLQATTQEEADEWVSVLSSMVPDYGESDDEDGGASAAAEPPAAPISTADYIISEDTEEARNSRRPLWLTIQEASGVDGVADGTCDPLVIVSIVHEEAEGQVRPETLQVLTDVQQQTLTPKWNDKILLPGVTASATIILTCVHYDGNEPYFLGQSCLRLGDDDNWRKAESMILPMGAMEDAYPPCDGAGKQMKFKGDLASGRGELTVRLEPVPLEQGLCTALRKRGDREGGGFTAWKDRWIAMAGSTVYYYTEYGDPPRPKKTIDLTDVAAVQHHDDTLELVDVVMKDGHAWHFRLPTPDAGTECLLRFLSAAGLPLPEGGDKGVSIAEKGGDDTNTRVQVMD